jgi:hypothetical protein
MHFIKYKYLFKNNKISEEQLHFTFENLLKLFLDGSRQLYFHLLCLDFVMIKPAEIHYILVKE